MGHDTQPGHDALLRRQDALGRQVQTRSGGRHGSPWRRPVPLPYRLDDERPQVGPPRRSVGVRRRCSRRRGQSRPSRSLAPRRTHCQWAGCVLEMPSAPVHGRRRAGGGPRRSKRADRGLRRRSRQAPRARCGAVVRRALPADRVGASRAPSSTAPPPRRR